MKKILKFLSRFNTFTSGFVSALIIGLIFFCNVEGMTFRQAFKTLSSAEFWKNDKTEELSSAMKEKVFTTISSLDTSTLKKSEMVFDYYQTTDHKEYFWIVEKKDSAFTDQLVKLSNKKLASLNDLSYQIHIMYKSEGRSFIMLSLRGKAGEEIALWFPGWLSKSQEKSFLQKADLNGFEKRDQ
jgi:hypothetical protein